MSAAVDSRIKIVSKSNGGASSARNAGLDATTGDYVMFVDSDDLLGQNACKRIVETFEQTDADIVTFGASCYPEGSGTPWMKDALSPRDIVYKSYSSDVLFKEKSHPFIRFALSRDFLAKTQLRFDESVPFGEDQILPFMAYPQARTTVFISDKLYNYRLLRKGSLTRSSREENARRIQVHLVVLDHILSGWKQQGWLGESKSQMIEWMVEFVLLDANKQVEPERSASITAFKECFEQYYPDLDIEVLDVSSPVRSLLRIACEVQHGHTRPQFSRILILRYNLINRGLSMCFRVILNKLLNRLRSILKRMAPFERRSVQKDFEDSTKALNALRAEYSIKRAG
jgi:hypothetical protein